jgi:putative ABC transport system substrate-binding protein
MGGDPARLAAFAAELVDLKVNVIFCGPGTPTAMAVKKATATIPIVFVGAGDAVGAGLVASLARPGGNATGLVNQSQDLAGKQMEILKEAVPNLSRMGVLWRPSNPSYRNLITRFAMWCGPRVWRSCSSAPRTSPILWPPSRR